MRLNHAFGTAAVALLGSGFAQASDESVRQVAIVGAGAAGSSAAYFLRQFAAEAGVHVNVTVFEKTDRIGGRTLTTNPFNDPTQRFEQGASIFVKVNHILYNAMTEFGLSPSYRDADVDSVMGIWDGDRFVFTIDQNAPSWWKILKVIRKYGISGPRKVQHLTATTVAKFLRLYEPQFFPFESLTQRAEDLGLLEVTGVTGEQYLEANDVDARYARGLVQASTRVNYASNLAQIHGLDTMVSMAADGALAVEGGNWQIFHEMIQRSGAVVALNTTVIGIDKVSDSTTSQQRYAVQTRSGSALDSSTTHPVTFDHVVLANPFQFSGISVGEGVLETAIDEIPYVQLHVTIFTSPYRLSPEFFGLPTSAKVPGMVLTTLAQSDTPSSGVGGVGKAGFLSVSMLGQATNPQTKRREYVYKIFSPEAVTPEFLSRLLGRSVPSGFTGSDSPISWYLPHVFNSYPRALPRVTFQDPVVGAGVYYTSGMESFISTMETNALMGKNVARLVVDDMQGATVAKSKNGLAWEEKQSILV
ncbi:hypothetical protein MYCTH_2308190 [Thermothelomyces thermophilus ATCC 42464]|uniref:Prenylcysteine lyase domain-containing protein n=1 Tax=Thermothelomyces thermophilus (strain ATCC 42464 / BCRC 31852 / DSM 1799) TaxID=573729 RepID=G2QJF1_THET4|nr:uncharacterized protein MYCTH_2308190 [Thermothelomyces thermophilus ATCC 42464]AEO59708.1 hypothetical protein MYCTH_2308190 [Thermothelomyces thermophilus ATCC 42464]